MTGEQITGLILIIFGFYSVIRFRYNGKTALKHRKEIEQKLSSSKTVEIKKTDIAFAQFMYLLVGILFILIGLAKLF